MRATGGVVRALCAASVGSALLLTVGPATAAPGDLDPAFGSGGIVQTTVGQYGSGAAALALQPDGKIVLAGTATGNMALTRHLQDGKLDPDFGSGGIAIGPSGDPSAVALQPDGGIVVAGTRWYPQRMVVARFLQDGTLDTTFGAGGIVIGPSREGHGVAVQSDGRIVVAGSGPGNDSRDDFVLARYEPDGAVDSGFGTGGVVHTRIGASSQASSVVVQSDGDIAAAGESMTSMPYPRSVMAVARYVADGSLDPAFGSGGTATAAVGSTSASASSLELQPDGRLVVAGTADDQIAVARFLPSGSLDPSFAGDGATTTPVGSWASGEDVALAPGGSIAVAGGARSFAVARYKPDGSLDTGFGADGVTTTEVGFSSRADAVGVLPDGRILVAGYSFDSAGSHFTIARYLVTTPTTIAAQPPVVDYGDSVSLSGTLTSRHSAAVEVLERRCDDATPSQVATTTAGPDGAWTTNVAPEMRTEYRAAVTPERSSGLTVRVRPRLTLTRSSGRSLRARALFGSSLAGQGVVLQRYSRRLGGWVDLRDRPMRRIGRRETGVVSGATFRIKRRPGRRLRIMVRQGSAFDCFATSTGRAIRG